MLQLPGYRVDCVLSLGVRSIVYRGKCLKDSKPVVIKERTAESLSYRDLARFQYAFQLCNQLEVEGVCKPYELLEFEKRPVLVMEDVGGVSLRQYIEEHSMDVSSFLMIAIQLASILDRLHQKMVIHKDIKPANIIVEPTRKRVQLIDFELASQLTRETPEVQSLSSLEGTLGYIAPEQTGRMNRTVDYRSDLYSLGVTFYEMFVGELPFSGSDPMSLIHSHIAVVPSAPHIENTHVPLQISKMILKLMAKTPEDRYQSAFGLKQDLQRCLEQFLQTGSVPLFPLGITDLSPQLQISQRLYGREQEIRGLMKAFAQASVGDAQFFLVSGYSGVGKTSLIKEVHKPIVEARGSFLSGKFDQFQNIPYAAISQAFSQKVQDILTEPEEVIRGWKDILEEALGSQAQLMQDVIPELALLLGEQPAVPMVAPIEAQNRFHRVFSRFVGAFATPDSPLVLFLDDLQWANSASIQLLKLLLTDPSMRYLFVIGAYRDNEVSDAHPLSLLIQELEEKNSNLTQISLQPLQLKDVCRLVSDTLHQSIERVTPLGRLIFEKTLGNPFFVERFLLTIYEDDLLSLDRETHHWTWDMAGIQGKDVSAHVAELMSQQILRLPEASQELLQLASCVGNRFSLQLLGDLVGQTPQQVSDDLWPAVEEELIVPIGDEYRFIGLRLGEDDTFLAQGKELHYRFLHDRIQEGASELLDSNTRAEAHLNIGQLLKKNGRVEEYPEALFDVVNHLNMGRSLLTLEEDRDELAALNLQAARRAMEASAWQSALAFVTTATDLLPDDLWQHNREEAFNFYFSRLEAAVACGEHDLWERLEALLLEKCHSLKEKTLIHKLRIKRLLISSEHADAIQASLEALALFGFETPDSREGWQSVTMAEGARIAELLDSRAVASLSCLPAMTDPDAILQLELLVELAPTSMVKPELFAFVVSKMARLSIEYGHNVTSPIGYIYYAAFLAALQEYEQADAFGQLALDLNDMYGSALRAPVDHMYGSFVAHWQHPFREVLVHLRRSLIEGTEHGIFNSAGWATLNITPFMLEGGVELSKLLKKAQEYALIGRDVVKYTDIYSFQLGMQHIVIDLMGLSDAKKALEGDGLSVEEIDSSLSHYPAALGYLYTHQLGVMCILGQYDEALEKLGAAQQTAAIIPQGVAFAALRFYENILFAAKYSEAEEETKAHYVEAMEANLRQYAVWAKGAPENYKAKHLLMEVELQVLKDPDCTGIMEQYDHVIHMAQIHGLLHVEGMALERAGRYCLSRNQPRMARGYLIDAHLTFMSWGALAKVQLMESEFPTLHANQLYHWSPARNVSTSKTGTQTSTGLGGQLDMLSIQKATQAISSEIVLEGLLSKLLHIVVENAGAQKGFLLLRRHGELLLEAQVDTIAGTTQVLQGVPLEEAAIPVTLIRFVARSQERVVLGNAIDDQRYGTDLYIVEHKPRSVLCMPIRTQNKMVGVLYIENQLLPHAFTAERCAILDILAAQAAISLENATLYNELEAKVVERTHELSQTLEQLEERHLKLQNAQAQLVESEKMASLGSMVAGVAHEINNPANFTLQGANNLHRRLTEFKRFIFELADANEDSELTELFDKKFAPMFRNLGAISDGTERIKHIVDDLRSFSRLDEGEFKRADVIAGLETALTLFKANTSQDVDVVCHYMSKPRLDCWPAQLNQVFMNIMVNAHQAIRERRKPTGENSHKGTLHIVSSVKEDHFLLQFKDDGCGMSEEVLEHIFEPFFTTRSVGEGTGLGMSMSYGIIQKHKGRIEVHSEEGKGTSVTIFLPLSGTV